MTQKMGLGLMALTEALSGHWQEDKPIFELFKGVEAAYQRGDVSAHLRGVESYVKAYLASLEPNKPIEEQGEAARIAYREL